MTMRPFVIAGLLLSLLTCAGAQLADPNAESTLFLSISTLQRNRTYGYTPSVQDSRIVAGAGFIYGNLFSRHFSMESHFELQAGSNVFQAALTGNLVYSYFPGEGRSALFARCGYGIEIPSIFVTSILKLDVGVFAAGGGIKLPMDDDHLLRIELQYTRNRVYQYDAGSRFDTFSSLGIRIGYTLFYTEQPHQERRG